MRIVLLFALALLTACGRPRDAWQPSQAEATAWWIEDLAHGQPRDPGELDFVAAGERARAIQRWAGGNDIRGQWEPPRRLAARQARWPALKAALRSGDALPRESLGLIAPAPGLPAAKRAVIEPLVDAENNDRRFLDQVLLEVGGGDDEVDAAFREAVRCARWQLDRALGAGVGQGAPDVR